MQTVDEGGMLPVIAKSRRIGRDEKKLGWLVNNGNGLKLEREVAEKERRLK